MKMKKSNLSNSVQILTVLTVLFIALCLFVPIWQTAISSQLKIDLAREESKVEFMENRKTTLEATIERQKMPEYVIRQASSKKMNFTRIDTDIVGTVASYR